MISDTAINRLWLRMVICLLQYIGPICLAYTAYVWIYVRPEWPLDGIIRVYCAAEGAFYIFFLFYSRHLQREASHPPLRSSAERRALFYKVRSEINDPEKFLSGWFGGARIEDIGREDVIIFFNWAIWEGRAQKQDDAELQEYVLAMESTLGRKFPPGSGTAKSLRLTIDPFDVEPRSLFWYFLIMTVDTISFPILSKHGFEHHGAMRTSLSVFPPRLGALTRPWKSASSHLSYWLRPHTSKTRLPILYLHGIGIGLLTYATFLKELETALNAGHEDDDDQVGILVVEILPVSSRLTNSLLARADFVAELTSVLDHHHYTKFVLAAHSFGTLLSTHILSDKNLCSRVSSAILVDPISILLHMPDVTYNFTARRPERADEWLLWYFASKDPGVAHTLARRFFWAEHILWQDRIMKLINEHAMNLTFSIASNDIIISPEAVTRYLLKMEIPDPVITTDDTRNSMHLAASNPSSRASDAEINAWKNRPWTGEGLDLLWWPGLDHGEAFDRPDSRTEIVRVLVAYVQQQQRRS